MKLLAEHFNLATGEFMAVNRRSLPPDYETPRVHIAPTRKTEHKPVGRSRGPDLLKHARRCSPTRGRWPGHRPARSRARSPSTTPPAASSPSHASPAKLRDVRQQRCIGNSPARGTAPPPRHLLDARGLGTLVHDVLATHRLQRAQVAEQIADWCEHLAPQHVIHNAEHAAREASKT